LRDAWEPDDDGRAVVGGVEFPVSIVDGERLAFSILNRAILAVVGFRLSNGLVLDSRVEVVVDAGCGHGLDEVTVVPSIDTELFGVSIKTSGVLPLFPPLEHLSAWVVEEVEALTESDSDIG
jgi:hypothetical protein